MQRVQIVFMLVSSAFAVIIVAAIILYSVRLISFEVLVFIGYLVFGIDNSKNGIIIKR